MENVLDDKKRHTGSLPGFANIQNVPISPLIKHSGLIFAILLIVFFICRQYILEYTLDRGFIYKRVWPTLNARQKRGFVNHHLSIAAKIFVVIIAIYPLFAVAVGKSDFRTPLFGSEMGIKRHHGVPTVGDVLYFAVMIVSTMYAHELMYREGISYVAVLHHVGVIVMGQLTLFWSGRTDREPDAALEAVLALFWGFFDLSVEVPPHVTMIIYRDPDVTSEKLMRAFSIAFWCSSIGTLAETGTIFGLYGALFHKWTLTMKVLIPILHCIFTAAQVWGEYCTWCLWQQEKRKLASGERKGKDDLSTGDVEHQ
ncbi:hypothetical protein COCMIDRAFT_7621 [Bipolaris oryzae ATCC 44560]|uniref:TLC domain-containing protein n=1 Tax=Bipolaris oryzae ATCC 44560 TaxID=930090 RepID=W6YTQ4_COCMI|nr:uncharacterized protein COCMIDRAFT_7621 [Bipolaris oryzae ATCC 44560]EUC42832.1 hypothetical protein COCMIDRAFT_7621 [Bipolaris oryzae ATCC 44560]